MIVPLLVLRVYAINLHSRLHMSEPLLLIHHEVTVKCVKPSLHVADYHMFNGKPNSCVRRVEMVYRIGEC